MPRHTLEIKISALGYTSQKNDNLQRSNRTWRIEILYGSARVLLSLIRRWLDGMIGLFGPRSFGKSNSIKEVFSRLRIVPTIVKSKIYIDSLLSIGQGLGNVLGLTEAWSGPLWAHFHSRNSCAASIKLTFLLSTKFFICTIVHQISLWSQLCRLQWVGD